MTKEQGDEPFDIVIQTLTEKKDKLWKMTRSNIECNTFNIMDEIRLKHISSLEDCIQLWKENKKYVEKDS